MQVHIALYKWKSGATKDKIDDALSQISALQNKIDGIVEISCAKNESKFSEGYSHVILVRGQDAKALEEYRSHPDHKRAAILIESIEEKGIGVDFSTINSE